MQAINLAIYLNIIIIRLWDVVKKKKKTQKQRRWGKPKKFTRQINVLKDNLVLKFQMKLPFLPLSITSFSDIIIFYTFLREINTFFSKVKHRLLPVNLFCYTLIASQAAWQVYLSHLIQRVENVLSCFLWLDFGFSFMFTASLSRTKRKKTNIQTLHFGGNITHDEMYKCECSSKM